MLREHIETPEFVILLDDMLVEVMSMMGRLAVHVILAMWAFGMEFWLPLVHCDRQQFSWIGSNVIV